MDSSNSNFEYLFNMISIPILLVLGIFGDIFGLKIFFYNHKLKQIGPNIVYRYLFMNDILTILQIIFNFFAFGLGISVVSYSSAFCKTFNYLNYSFSAISPMLLVYISVDRLVSIKYPSKRKFLKTKTNQITFILFILAYNLIYYIPTIIGTDLKALNSNDSLYCDYIDADFQNIISFMDLFNRAILPFLSMTISSITLIVIIFISRINVMTHGSITEKKTFKKDVKFSVSSVILNLVFLLTSLPISLILFVPNYFNYTFLYSFFYWLFYLSYGLNFYVLYLTNSLFRKEAIKILCCNNFICEKMSCLSSQS